MYWVEVCTTPLAGKIRKKITKYYENTEIRGSKVIKKRNSRVSYFRNTCFFACLLFACLSPFLFYPVPHCKRIEIRSLCHMHQAWSKFFLLFLFVGEGGGIGSNDKTDQKCPRGALGESRGMTHGKLWKVGCLWMQFLRFESGMMWKQALKSVLKLKNGFFWAKD